METEKKSNLKSLLGTGNLSVLVGAAFLMATSAIGPGFLTQTATFTEQYTTTFAFAILIATLLSLVAQLNIWRIIAVTKSRGQDVANRVLPGLGYVVGIAVALGGLALNIGNIAGASMSFNLLFGMDVRVAACIIAVLGILIFVSKNIGAVVDKFSSFTGILMLVLITYVAIVSKPPVGAALQGMVMPSQFPILAILTIVGGTVGGYNTFSGGHRLVDAGLTGMENLRAVNRSAIMGLSIATFVRVLLFLATLGVVMSGVALDPGNPMATVFGTSAGIVGLKIFGVILFSESLNSVVGAAYTSISFLKSLFKPIQTYENWSIIGMICISSLIFILVGKPVNVLVVAGAVNGLILPITLGTMILASKRKDIIGDYKHPQWLFILGVIVVIVTGVMGIFSLRSIAQIWAR